jgi:hypothetical protein
VVLERIRFGHYRPQEMDIDAMNETFFHAMHDVWSPDAITRDLAPEPNASFRPCWVTRAESRVRAHRDQMISTNLVPGSRLATHCAFARPRVVMQAATSRQQGHHALAGR